VWTGRDVGPPGVGRVEPGLVGLDVARVLAGGQDDGQDEPDQAEHTHRYPGRTATVVDKGPDRDKLLAGASGQPTPRYAFRTASDAASTFASSASATSPTSRT